MPSLQEQLIKDFGDGFNKRAEELLNSTFLNNRQSWVTSIVNDYMRHNIDPNESISKIASQYNLNADQVQRLIEESNVNIYLQKYAQTKGRKIRRVQFPIADPTKINQKVNKAASDAGDKESSEMTKAASKCDMVFDAPDKFGNFLTSTAQYEPSLWEQGAPEKTAKELMKRKIEEKIAVVKKAKIQEMKNLLQKIAFIGDALIYNERVGQSAQNLLDKLASDANFSGYTQLPVINYVREKTVSLKEEKKLPSNFKLELKPTEKIADDFSLGKHSLIKKADDIVIKVDKLPTGTDYEKLVEVAKEIKKELEKNPPKDFKKPIVIEGV